MVEFLTLQDILDSHHEQIQSYGGTDGLRDKSLLESALAQPCAEFDGQYLHKDLFEMAAAYLFHLVQNHPFIDGNKRIGLEAALIFLEINDYSLNVDDQQLIDLVLNTAQGQIQKSQIADFFRARSCKRPFDSDS